MVLVLKGTGTVIPSQCKEELLVQFHEVHFSVDRTELRARDSVYWPGINKDIETLVKTCNTHQENSKRNNNRLSTRLCEKKGFFKRFDFQKKRFLQQKKRFSVPNG